MIGFFKSLGKALLYIISFPVIILGIAVFAAYGIIVFLIQFVKLTFLFFTGRSLFEDYDEDVKAKEIINRNVISKEEVKVEEVKKSEPTTNPYSIYEGDYQSFSSNFNKPDIDKEPEENEEIDHE